MHIDRQRIEHYLYDIKKNTIELEDLLNKYTDDALFQDPYIIKAVKYILIEIAEATANTLQHILAKNLGQPVSGYMDTLLKAKENGILTEGLFFSLNPFFKFRHALVHRYWITDDALLLKNLRSGYRDFYTFIEQIERKIGS